MKDTEKKIGIAILTGGLSSRMGMSKEKLIVNKEGVEQTFLESLCQEFADMARGYISKNKAQNYDISGFESITDIYEKTGPIGGIYSVLKNTTCDAILFVACDMPYFSKQAAEYLISKFKECDALIPVVDNIRQPLAGIYSKNCIPVMENMIESRQYKLGILIERVNYIEVDMTDYKKCFTNINTKMDYDDINS